METTKIAAINGISLTAETLDGETLIPIRPICQALGISFSTQRNKLQQDPDLAPTVFLGNTVGADGKEREMVCLPLPYIFGWLFSISVSNVSDEAREPLRRYRRECYDALWAYFYGKIKRQCRLNERENEIYAAKVEAMNREAECRKGAADAKADIRRCDQQLEALRRQRLDDQPALPGIDC